MTTKQNMTAEQFVKHVIRRLDALEKRMNDVDDDVLELGASEDLEARLSDIEETLNKMHKRGMS